MKDRFWFRLQSVFHKRLLLWLDSFAINGRFRHRPAKNGWELNGVKPLSMSTRQIVPDLMSAVCCRWIPMEHMSIQNKFIRSNFPFESKRATLYLISLLCLLLTPSLLFILSYWALAFTFIGPLFLRLCCQEGDRLGLGRRSVWQFVPLEYSSCLC